MTAHTFPTLLTYEIGLTYAGRVNVETLTSKKAAMAPRAEFVPYAESLQTLDRSFISRGAPYILWNWDGFIYADLFNGLRTICPGASVNVIIRSIAEDYATFGYYSAIMAWPQPRSYEQITTSKGLGYRNFALPFYNPITYTP